jgi:hypothetical protein
MTNVGRFSNVHLGFQPNSHNENQLIPLHVKTRLKIDLKFSLNENQFKFIHIYFENENRS